MALLNKKVFIKTRDDATRFVNLISKYDCNVDLTRGNITVDGKSILGVFILCSDKHAINAEITIDKSQQEALLESIKYFLV